jgi:InaD-like protein
VNIFKDAGTGLGISIVGGKVDGGERSGIFIKNVIPTSPAGLTGQLFTGDRVVEVGNVPLLSSDQGVAVDSIKNSGNPIKFVVQSLQPAKV